MKINLKIITCLFLFIFFNNKETFAQLIRLGDRVDLIEYELFMLKIQSEKSRKIFYKYNRDSVKIDDNSNSFRNVGRLVLEATPKKCHMQYRYFFPTATQIIDSMTINVMCSSMCAKKTTRNVKSYFTFLGGFGWRKLRDGLFISKIKIVQNDFNSQPEVFDKKKSYIIAKWEKSAEKEICFVVSLKIIKMDADTYKNLKNGI